jgi:hypothetical protein
MQMQVQQAQLAFQQSQTQALQAQAQESQARAGKLVAEAQAVPEEVEIDKINAITRNLKEGDQDDKEFERRMRVAETMLKEREVITRERSQADSESKNEQTSQAEQLLMSRLTQ